MIYSRTAEYAIRAFVNLAQVQDGKYAMVKNIAEQEDIPAHFLAKILQQLARKGLLRSSKGPTGGFALRVPAADVKLWDIVEALDGMSQYTACASGLSECSDEMPCSMHDSWVALRTRIIDYLERNTIADLVKALDQKRKTLATEVDHAADGFASVFPIKAAVMRKTGQRGVEHFLHRLVEAAGQLPLDDLLLLGLEFDRHTFKLAAS